MSFHSKIQDILQNAAAAHHATTAQLSIYKNQKLTIQENHELRKHHNNHSFLKPIDAATTTANIYYIRQRFQR